MNPQELRVGNWINSYYGTVRVTGLNDGKIHNIITTPDRVGASTGGMYSGIPITEEWLLRFGFEKQKFYDLEVFGIRMTNGVLNTLIAIAYHVDGSFFCNIKGNWIQNKILHVHQLQNLHFALTGEELILK